MFTESRWQLPHFQKPRKNTAASRGHIQKIQTSQKLVVGTQVGIRHPCRVSTCNPASPERLDGHANTTAQPHNALVQQTRRSHDTAGKGDLPSGAWEGLRRGSSDPLGSSWNSAGPLAVGSWEVTRYCSVCRREGVDQSSQGQTWWSWTESAARRETLNRATNTQRGVQDVPEQISSAACMWFFSVH